MNILNNGTCSDVTYRRNSSSADYATSYTETSQQSYIESQVQFINEATIYDFVFDQQADAAVLVDTNES
jgi:hypothetical protein